MPQVWCKRDACTLRQTQHLLPVESCFSAECFPQYISHVQASALQNSLHTIPQTNSSTFLHSILAKESQQIQQPHEVQHELLLKHHKQLQHKKRILAARHCKNDASLHRESGKSPVIDDESTKKRLAAEYKCLWIFAPIPTADCRLPANENEGLMTKAYCWLLHAAEQTSQRNTQPCFYVTNGWKFGVHFLLYAADPTETHSSWMVLVASDRNAPMDCAFFVRHARLATSVGKRLLIMRPMDGSFTLSLFQFAFC